MEVNHGNDIPTTVSQEAAANSGDVIELWPDIAEDDFSKDFQDHDNEEEVESTIATTIRWLLLYLLMWAATFGISGNAMDSLINFLHYVFQQLSQYNPFLLAFTAAFPTSLYMVRKYFKLDRDTFIKFVVCPSCHSLYNYEELLEMTDGKVRKCSFVMFPKHTHRSMRKPCGHDLLKKVMLSSGHYKYYPLKVYCYNQLAKSLPNLLERPGMWDLCKQWQSRIIPQNTYADVYDGKVWKSFKWKDGNVFFSNSGCNIGLILNCDWFPPFDRTQYSVGVLYAVVLNLPRSVRFKPENLLIIGIIPGPEEPPLVMNSYLKPLTDELLDLWEDGIRIQGNLVYVAAICIACDRPAACKIGGFLGHSSTFACSYCKKKFEYNKDWKKIDCSGFDSYPPRTHIDHKRNGASWLKAKTLAERTEIEEKFGCRFSQLSLLPYFDCIEYIIIDPMHNLFEGTAKRMLKKVWLSESHLVLKSQDTSKIHSIVQAFKTPVSVGRLPLKIISGYSSFTADQWKNWTRWFSLLARYDSFKKRDYECWQHFVLACTILCSPVIRSEELQRAHCHLKRFCEIFQLIYGKRLVTPNMHYHLHLAKCIENYGPPQAFWLFSFERYNGILGNYHTNQRAIEIQVMRKICSNVAIKSLAYSEPSGKAHLKIFSLVLNDCVNGSVKESLGSDQGQFRLTFNTLPIINQKCQ